MGDQSSGKSSVLEAISGIPFPRGSGLVTRCATQLTMKNVAAGVPWRAHIAVLWNRPQPKESGPVGSPAELTQRIEQLTEILCQNQKSAFSRDSIVVKVEAPGAPDLTLIDLPGIVRTATAGQDPAVIGQVNSLVESFLQQERTVVLAVVPANQDVATIDILERARGVDPEGVRTLGVLTKPDLVGPGSESEVMSVLRNERKPLKLGYVMVKCRSQRDLDRGVTPRQARVDEAKFFSEHPDWGQVTRPILGVQKLTERLTKLLVERIQIAMPMIKWELQSQLEISVMEVKAIGKGAPTTSAEQRNKLMRVASRYCGIMRQSARGFYSDGILAETPDVRLFGLCQQAFEVLKQTIMASRPQFGDPTFGERLAADMKLLRGRELPGFHNSQAFYNFVAQSVENWRPAVEHCRARIVHSARSVSGMLIATLVPGYPALASVITDIATKLINELSDDLVSKLEDIFVKESDPFTTNENMLDLINQLRFRNFDRALGQVMNTVEKGDSMSDMEAQIIQRFGGWYMQSHGVNVKSKVEDMIIMIEAYWDVATKRIVDNVCMTMEHDFLGKLLKRLESECFLLATDFGQKSDELDALFAEDPGVRDRRRSLIAKRDRLSGALQTLRRMAPDCVASKEPPRKTVAQRKETQGANPFNGQ